MFFVPPGGKDPELTFQGKASEELEFLGRLEQAGK